MSQIQSNISLTSNITLPESFYDKLLLHFGFSEQQIKQSRDNTKTNDIYKLKEYLDDNIDLYAAFKKYQEAKDNGDTKASEQLKKQWTETDENENKINDTNNDTTDETKDNNDNFKFPVQVFVRFRPLIKSEIEGKHNEIIYKTKSISNNSSNTIIINDITKKQRKSNIQRPNKNSKTKAPKTTKIAIKKFKGFRSILSANDNNIQTFNKCILPSIDNVLKGCNVCCFAYGHTGSGKTHTIMGYDEKISPGMYRLTAKYINDQLQIINKNINIEQDKILLSCQFAELYQGKMRDLFSDNLCECFVREDDFGNINIRGPTLHNKETGNVKVQPLQQICISDGEVNKLIENVNKSLLLRKQGSSAVHDESSRSHVFLQMELVTKRLIIARNLLWNLEGEYTPIGKAFDDLKMLQGMRRFKKDETTGEYRFDCNYKASNEEIISKKKLETEVIQYKIEIEKSKILIREIENKSNKCVLGTFVFVDLAGNEWGSDSKGIMKGNNKIQMKERQEINKSLLALKECIRALHSKNRQHIPYRDSKLTMVLRPHLKAKTSTAIMIANVSPSDNHIKKTYNTLKYSQLVAKA